jgi:hypothetical protein
VFPEDGFAGLLDGRTSAGITRPAMNLQGSRLDSLGVRARGREKRMN